MASNPYESPNQESVNAGGSRQHLTLPQTDIAAKAKQLLVRRDAPNSPWFYIRRDWHRQSLFLVAYIAIPIALWFINFTMLAVAAACFFAGTKCRDVRWWVALSKEWPTTAEFVDWQKVEDLAGNGVPT